MAKPERVPPVFSLRVRTQAEAYGKLEARAGRAQGTRLSDDPHRCPIGGDGVGAEAP